MKKHKLKSGYYWVKSFDDRWYIAQYITPSTWVKFNDPEFYKSENFKEIYKNPIEQPFGFDLFKAS